MGLTVAPRTRPAPSRRPHRWDVHERDQWARSWVRACVVAETIGMGAAATAAVLAQRLGPVVGPAVVVCGGLVEGVALGWLQSSVLARRFPRLVRRGYLSATVVVAGLGWAAASAPAALAGDDAGTTPPWPVVVVGAAGLGLVMGVLLGAAQSLALRGAVARPRRWTWVSAAGWTAAMVVVFTGATLPSASWSPAWILLTGPVTGAAAGAVLGLVTAPLVPWLGEPHREGPTATATGQGASVDSTVVSSRKQ